VDLHHPAAHQLLNQFRFVPDARLDDLMISHATDGGGVGPHFDSYDVFLLQAHGRRRWRIGRQKDLSLQEGVPLKILANFEPEEEYVLEPGDMLYLPPRYAHDGVSQRVNARRIRSASGRLQLGNWPTSCCCAWPTVPWTMAMAPVTATLPSPPPARRLASLRL
jgi:hypothetical protein